MSDQHPQDEQADQLTDELAKKYDPERMLRMVSRRAGKGERLDQSIRAKYEQRFGVDLGHVRIYTGEFAEEFKHQLSQRYQYHNVKQACEDKGYAVEEEVNEEDGSIRLVVRKWVSE